jgi:hypothetical protein
MKKSLGILLVVVLVLAAAVWYFLAFRLDGVIEAQIEQAGSAALGTTVSVGSVQTDIRGGSLTISSITVANPPGFKNENALSLNGIEAAVDYENFDIKRVVIDKPEIVIEEQGGESNFAKLLAGMEQGAAEPQPADEGGPDPILTIRHFRMNEARAAFESESLDRYSDLKVDAVELNNVKGTPAEVSTAIANAIIEEVAKEAATELLKAKASEKMNSILGRD